MGDPREFSDSCDRLDNFGQVDWRKITEKLKKRVKANSQQIIYNFE